MSNFRKDKPTILVTDAGRGSAISFIRSLGRKGWNIIAADSTPMSPGFYSRYTWKRLVYPEPESEPDELVDALFSAACDWGVDLIIPVTDEVILPLSAQRERFEGICKLALPEPELLEIVTDKIKTLELACRQGVPVPKTVLVHTVREACDRAPEMGWPVVLKPQVSRLYRDRTSVEFFSVCYADGFDSLVKQMQRFEGRCPILLQEYYPGSGKGVELLLNQGKPLAAFQHRRIREVPVHGGASSFRESVPLETDLYTYSIDLLGALNWTGLAMVEFKAGVEGAKLMEINGRVWGSLPLAVRSGMDFPGLMAELYLFGPPALESLPRLDYRIGIRVRNLSLDTVWIATVLSGRRRYPFLEPPGRYKGLLALVELLNPTYRYDIQSLEDPLPGFMEIPKIVGKFGKKLMPNWPWEIEVLSELGKNP
jgi:predicted ATP-grasp superfamily ATP-dependent carboligase